MPHKLPLKKKNEPGQFLDLLSTADEIQIREISKSNRQRILSTLDRFTREVTGGSETDRVFFVHVRSKPGAAPQIEDALPTATEDLDYLLENAKILLRHKEYLLARNLYSYLLKQDLKHPDALEGLGICMIGLGQPAAARKCFRAIWDLHGKESALYWLGQCYLKEGLDDLAIKYFQRIQSPEQLGDGIRFEMYKDLGNCLTRAGEMEQAARAYEKALEIFPDSAAVHVNFGTMEFQRKNVEAARKHFALAMKLDDANPRALCGMGMVHVHENKLDEAKAIFSRALELDPSSTVAIFHLYDIAEKEENLKSVRDTMAAFLDANPKNNDVRYAFATILHHEGRLTECERHLGMVLTQDPRHQKAAKLLSEIMANRHRT